MARALSPSAAVQRCSGRRFGASLASGAAGGSQCIDGCGRLAAPGYHSCCRTCHRTRGKSHGHRCEVLLMPHLQEDGAPLARGGAASAPRCGQRAVAAAASEEAMLSAVARDCELPAPVLPPSSAPRPQLLASKHAFAAASGGAVVCVSAGALVENSCSGAQVFRCHPRGRSLQCCALSRCGRFLAAGEAGVPAAAARQGAQVLVFDRMKGGQPTLLRGHSSPNGGVQMLAWSAEAALLASIALRLQGTAAHAAELVLWSWPQAERLAVAVCGHLVADICFAPEGFVFATVGGSSVKRWSVMRSEADCKLYVPAAAASAGSDGFLRLVGKQLAAETVFGTQGRASHEDAVTAATWGRGCELFLGTRRGHLLRIRDEVDRRSGFGPGCQVTSLVWSQSVCDEQLPGGFLICSYASSSGLSGGGVRVIAAETLQLVAELPAAAAHSSACAFSAQGPAEVLGSSCSLDGEAVWLLYSDRRLVRWRSLQEAEPDWSIEPAGSAAAPLQDARCVPGAFVPQVVTSTTSGLRLWTVTPMAMRLDKGLTLQGHDDGQPPARELTVMAVSPWIVACGHSSGEATLFSVPEFVGLQQAPARHAGPVTALAFGTWRPGCGAPLLLASAAMDRSVRLCRINVRTGSVGVEASVVTDLLSIVSTGLTSPVQRLAIVGTASMAGCSLDAGKLRLPCIQLAACTADQQLIVRSIDVGAEKATVATTLRQPVRGMLWVDLCAHPAGGAFYAACADRRILKFNSRDGRVEQQVRLVASSSAGCSSSTWSNASYASLPGCGQGMSGQHSTSSWRSSSSLATGGDEVQLAAPLRIAEGDGSLLAVGTCGAGQGGVGGGVGLILICATSLTPLVRLLGRLEMPVGLSFLNGPANPLLFGCWPDGGMLFWKMPDNKEEASAGDDASSSALVRAEVNRGPQAAWMPAGPGICSPRVSEAPSSPLYKRRQQGLNAGPRGQESVVASDGSRSDLLLLKSSASGYLEKLLSCGPKPPRWAVAAVAGLADGGKPADSTTPRSPRALEDEERASSVSGRRCSADSSPPPSSRTIGKWAHSSQVRSAADLHGGLQGTGRVSSSTVSSGAADLATATITATPTTTMGRGGSCNNPVNRPRSPVASRRNVTPTRTPVRTATTPLREPAGSRGSTPLRCMTPLQRGPVQPRSERTPTPRAGRSRSPTQQLSRQQQSPLRRQGAKPSTEPGQPMPPKPRLMPGEQTQAMRATRLAVLATASPARVAFQQDRGGASALRSGGTGNLEQAQSARLGQQRNAGSSLDDNRSASRLRGSSLDRRTPPKNSSAALHSASAAALPSAAAVSSGQDETERLRADLMRLYSQAQKSLPSGSDVASEFGKLLHEADKLLVTATTEQTQ
eukprot:TRINITY_DN44821_c0_g2_i1.p1 TRINITY_DN44821_c0_g2~~TRINITY_DN44821_c0_g2_i1.p1  ORF type:complete len:1368 (+),score=260.76 TRINITY_DN44821_c0_g2_i1:91-4194(+)